MVLHYVLLSPISITIVIALKSVVCSSDEISDVCSFEETSTFFKLFIAFLSGHLIDPTVGSKVHISD